ncbi:MAG: S-layer homology domain-containing protein, partial [Candidatus Ornithomonoglobus sp.]
LSTGVTNDIGVLKLTVPAGTDTFKVSINGAECLLSDVAGNETTFDECTITVPASAAATEAPETTEAPTEAPTAAPFTGDETVKFGDLANTTGLENLIGFDVTVTGTYGKDYVAFLGKTQLTEDEFLDAVHGYTATPAELIANLTIVANDGVTITVTPATQTAEQAGKDSQTWTLYPGLAVTKTISIATPTPTAPAPTAPAPTATPKPGTGGGSSSSTRPGGGSGNTIASSSGSSASSGGIVPTTAVNFQDLSSVPWAQTAINALASMGVINGRSNTEFDPNSTVTRAEFAKMVCAAFGVQPSTKTTQTFTDVLTSDWYFGYVEAAAEKGIVLGVTDTEFDPNALITREQMATMMYRAINVTGAVLKQGTSKTFADAYEISDYAKAPVDALSSAGVINGVDDSTFAPKDNATRAQAACIIYQYFTSLAG